MDPERESVGHLLALDGGCWLAVGGEKNGCVGGEDGSIVIER